MTTAENIINSSFALFGPPKVLTADYILANGIRDIVQTFTPLQGFKIVSLQSKNPLMCYENCLVNTFSSYGVLVINKGISYNKKKLNPFKAKTFEEAEELAKQITNKNESLDKKYKDGFGVDQKSLDKANKEIEKKLIGLFQEYRVKKNSY